MPLCCVSLNFARYELARIWLHHAADVHDLDIAAGKMTFLEEVQGERPDWGQGDFKWRKVLVKRHNLLVCLYVAASLDSRPMTCEASLWFLTFD